MRFIRSFDVLFVTTLVCRKEIEGESGRTESGGGEAKKTGRERQGVPRVAEEFKIQTETDST